MPDCVLDLDLDFFVWPIAHYQHGNQRLPAEECKNLCSEGEVCHFLENHCRLSKDNRIPGVQVVEHEDAFRVWRRWLGKGKITAPFTVVHVDAHADLGAGLNQTCHYIETDLLARPIHERSAPLFGPTGLNSGNYLAFAIANRWIDRLLYVYPTDPTPPEEQNRGDPADIARLEELYKALGDMEGDDDLSPPVSDLPHWCFRNHDWRTGVIELAQRTPQAYLQLNSVPVQVEPGVPFEVRPFGEFQFSGFTHMVVAQSPQYTPALADLLLPIIQEYFDPA
jgi:hypothetical protein